MREGPPPPSADTCRAILEAIVEVTDLFALFVDTAGTIRFATPAVAGSLELASVEGEPIDTILSPEADGTRFAARLVEDSLAREPIALATASGEVRTRRLSSRSIRPDGELAGFLLYASPEAPTAEEPAELIDQFGLFNQIFRHDVRNDANLLQELITRFRRSFDADTLTDEQEGLLEQISETSDRMLSLTERSRDLIEALEELGTEPSAVPLEPILTKEVAKASMIDGADVRVVGEIPEVEVRASRMLDAVIRNLLTNAIEHDPDPSTTVEVEVRECDGRVEISVVDEGPGMPADIATALEAGEIALDTHEDATFGLYIVSTLVGQYGGGIRVEERNTSGTAVTVALLKSSVDDRFQQNC